MPSTHGKLFSTYQRIFLLENFLPKILNLEPEIIHFGKFVNDIKILNAHNILCYKFAAVCRKPASSFLPFQTYNQRCCYCAAKQLFQLYILTAQCNVTAQTAA